MSPMILRSITVNKEQAAILRVALAAALERKGLFSEEGRAIAINLAGQADDILAIIHQVEEEQQARRR